MDLDARINNDFAYHPPSNDTVVKQHEKVRKELGVCAHLLVTLCPEGRELSTALTKLEEAMMWANAAIARNQ